MKDKINIVCGATASGKTKYAISLAKQLDAVVINADSMQIYKEIPILTAQPTEQEKESIIHKMYGFINCGDEFSLGHWLKHVTREIEELKAHGRQIILVGGTGLYLSSLISGISDIPDISIDIRQKVRSLADSEDIFWILQKKDPKAANTIKPNDHQRIMRALEVHEQTGQSILSFHNKKKISFYNKDHFNIIYLERERKEIYDNINNRFIYMIQHGAIDEVKDLLKIRPNVNYPKAHGLYEIIDYLTGNISLEDCINISQKNTRNYAKRQITWLKNKISFNQIINYDS